MKYLLGDSHATELYMAWSDKFPDLKWSTLLGLGLQNLVRDNNRGMIVPRKTLLEKFESLEKESIIFLSFTDIDGRLGTPANCPYLEEDYKNALALIKNLTDFEKIIMLDWYSISSKEVSEQRVSSAQRVITRDRQLKIFNDLKDQFPLEIVTTRFHPKYETEEGFALPKVTRDDVHYNFNHDLHVENLLPVFERIYNENK